MLNVSRLDIEDVLIFKYDIKKDNRGISYSYFSKEEMEKAGIYTEFVQRNTHTVI